MKDCGNSKPAPARLFSVWYTITNLTQKALSRRNNHHAYLNFLNDSGARSKVSRKTNKRKWIGGEARVKANPIG